MTLTLIAVVTGIGIGSIYGLVAIGYATVFSATRTINLAQGDLVMVGVMLLWFTTQSWGWPRWAAILGVLVVIPALSMLIERIAVRPLRHRTDGIGWFISTLAAAIVIETIVLRLYGNRPVYALPNNIGGSASIGSVSISNNILLAVGVLIVCLVAAEVFYRRTWLGASMRSIANDQQLAILRGVNPDQMGLVAYLIGGLLAAVAAIVIAPLVGSDPSIGLTYSISGFVALAVGGFGSLRGAAIGGWLLGIAEEVFSRYYNAQFEVLAGLGLLVIVLVARPAGIFGNSRARRV